MNCISKNTGRVFFILMFFLSVAWIDPFRDKVSEGNSSYNDGKYPEAAEFYREADQFAPGEKDKAALAFNKGTAEYMKGNYEAAIDLFKKSLDSGDRNIQKKALLNMGNAFLKMGKNREAADSYINSLKIDPSYEKAKKNIEYMLAPEKEKQENGSGEQDKKDSGADSKNSGSASGDKDEKTGSSDDRQSASEAEKKISREQIKNILESMGKKHVNRKKGGADAEPSAEKPW